MRLSGAVGALIGLGIASEALADPGLLTGDALRSAVSGRTVHLSTPIGPVPINYRGNGTMSGASKMLAQVLGSERDTGTCWIDSDRLCQRWQTWLDGQQHCYTMRVQGGSVHWTRDDGRTGVATISR